MRRSETTTTIEQYTTNGAPTIVVRERTTVPVRVHEPGKPSTLKKVAKTGAVVGIAGIALLLLTGGKGGGSSA